MHRHYINILIEAFFNDFLLNLGKKANDTLIKIKEIHKIVKLVLIYKGDYCNIKDIKKKYMFILKLLHYD